MGTIRKIDLMHREFGKCEGKLCKECSNFYRRQYHGVVYRKCEIYGNSCSEATDWKASYPACGMFNQKWDAGEVVRLVRAAPFSRSSTEPLEGQIMMEGL